MSQQPAKRHVLADIRIQCGLTQKQLAKLLGIAAITLQRIEQATLGLSEEIAAKAQEELDVSASWLLANNPKAAPVTPRQGLWTKELYEFAQGSAFITIETKPSGEKIPHYRYGSAVAVPRGASDAFIAWRLTDYCARINAMLETTRSTPRQGILIHRLEKMLNSLAEDFSPDPATLQRYTPRIDKLHNAYLTAAHKIYRKEMEELEP